MSLVLAVIAAFAVAFIAVVVLLEIARRRPLSATDLVCAALDERLSERPAERRPPSAQDARDDRPRRRTGAGRGARSPGIAV